MKELQLHQKTKASSVLECFKQLGSAIKNQNLTFKSLVDALLYFWRECSQVSSISRQAQCRHATGQSVCRRQRLRPLEARREGLRPDALAVAIG